MLRTGIITTYLISRLLVRSGFRNTYPGELLVPYAKPSFRLSGLIRSWSTDLHTDLKQLRNSSTDLDPDSLRGCSTEREVWSNLGFAASHVCSAKSWSGALMDITLQTQAEAHAGPLAK
jgi:hypothetical protein